MTLAVPRRPNIPRPTKKDPKDTLECAFNKLAWGFFPDGGSTEIYSFLRGFIIVLLSMLIASKVQCSESFLSRGIFATIRNLRKNSCNVSTNSKKLRSSCRSITFANWISGFAERLWVVMGQMTFAKSHRLLIHVFHKTFSSSFARARDST